MNIRAQKYINVEIQTDPVDVALSDLKSRDIEKLLEMLQHRFEQKIPAIAKIEAKVVPVEILTDDNSQGIELEKQ